MRLRTQLALAFLLLAVLPLGAMTLYAYAASQEAYRRAVAVEARQLADDMSVRLGEAVDELSSRIGRLRRRSRPGSSPAFEEARRQALAEAEQDELQPLLAAILSGASRQPGTIPFAFDAAGRLHGADAAGVAALSGLGLTAAALAEQAGSAGRGDWIVMSQEDPASGITVGVARPLGEALLDIRRTALRNLAYGLAVVLLALVGILPLSRHMTRSLDTLTDAAERLGRGERGVRVRERGSVEVKRLAATFNRMAWDLAEHHDRRLAQERLHKELEISRRIQEELLPPDRGRLPFLDVAGLSIPAREVGGDFYNYFSLAREEAVVLVGDVSGKGVPAAILMANLQATLRARLALERDLARLADHLDHELGAAEPRGAYLTACVAILDGRGGRLRYVSAGHDTQLLLRGDGRIERLESTGRPIGLLPGGGYEERQLPIARGDSLLLFTDGLLDAEDESGEPFGLTRLEAVVTGHDGGPVAGLLGRVAEALRSHRGRVEATDDATILALCVSEGPAGAARA